MPDSDGSEVCLVCGFCCDGTLFDRAVTHPADSVEFLVQIGLTPIMAASGELTAFRLPCHHFTGKCSIYGQKRPTTCGNYRCQLLRSVDRGKYSVAEAQQIVRATRALIEALPADFDAMVAELPLPSADPSLLSRLGAMVPLLLDPAAAGFREKYGKSLKAPFALLRNFKHHFVPAPPQALCSASSPAKT